jgi:hypothetical protein
MNNEVRRFARRYKADRQTTGSRDLLHRKHELDLNDGGRCGLSPTEKIDCDNGFLVLGGVGTSRKSE